MQPHFQRRLRPTTHAKPTGRSAAVPPSTIAEHPILALLQAIRQGVARLRLPKKPIPRPTTPTE